MVEITFRSVTLAQGRVKLEELSVDPAVIAEPFIIVRPELLGICSADLREIRGERHLLSTFGHEMVGEVVAAGGDVTYAPGDRVVYNPNVPLARTSGFADLFVTSSADPVLLQAAYHRAPIGAPAQALIFVEPLAAAIRCVDKLLARAGQVQAPVVRLAIIGAGIFGLLIGLEAHARGCKVTILNRSAERLAFARAAGQRLADLEFDFLGRYEGAFDAVILATAAVTPDVWRAGLALAQDGGFVHLFGATRPGMTWLDSGQDLDTIRRRECLSVCATEAGSLWISGSHGAGPEQMAGALTRLGCPSWGDTVLALIVDQVGLEDLPARLDVLSRTTYVGRVAVNPTQTNIAGRLE